LLSCATHAEIEAFLDGLSPNALAALPFLFEHWAHAGHQLPPDGDWQTWVIMGGRGAGKTRAGAEWVRTRVEGARPQDAGLCRRIALVSETYDQARDVMVFGESGILASSPPDRRPVWQASRRRLVWPNGAEAQVLSASDPEAVRGPQFDCAWADELAKWPAGGRETWDNLQFALRLGDDPRMVVTTTPRNSALLKQILGAAGTAVTRAPTSANGAYLSEGFLDRIEARYGGTRTGRQEIDGELLEDAEGALWTRALLDAHRVADIPALDRIVVAVDPPVTTGPNADECGIIVAGLKLAPSPKDWTAYVLKDASLKGASPSAWAERITEMCRSYHADRVVAEVNQGGDLVEMLLRQSDPSIPFKAVRATRGKGIRAEPVAGLYERGRVCHVGSLPQLEDQLCLMTPMQYLGYGSPDRADALIWAITDLLVDRMQSHRSPQVRLL
jgi:phage terminase large subunit-like protein